MDPWTHQRDRERQARLEVGETDVRAGVARLLVLLFVLVMVSAGIVQLVAGRAPSGAGSRPTASVTPSPCSLTDALAEASIVFRRAEGGLVDRVIAGNRIVLRRLSSCEDHLEDQSVLGRAVRPPVQSILTRLLGAGNEQAYVGRGGWLFYRPGVDHLTGPGFLQDERLAARRLAGDEWTAPPQPDPRTALVDFQRQLRERGITLVVVPTPVKPTVHPERLAGAARDAAPLRNRSFGRFRRDLEAAGVFVFDPAALLVETARATGEAQYLGTDTHWRPDAMTRVADALASFIREHVDLPVSAAVGYDRRAVTVRNEGDIVAMLELDPSGSAYAPETVVLQRVTHSDGRAWSPGPGSDVLLLGDSFSNIYSLASMGWGDSAGLAEQLSFALRLPIDRIVRNDAGAYATRQALATDLARGVDRLSRARVVIYQFATRELSFGDWRVIHLPAGRAAMGGGGFLMLAPGDVRTVTGTVSDASSVPRPGTVPYRDHIRALGLSDLSAADGQGALGRSDALVYLWSMRDNVWTAAATLAPGDRVTLRVRTWDDVASDYEGINRSELESDRFLLADPLWGEAVEP